MVYLVLNVVEYVNIIITVKTGIAGWYIRTGYIQILAECSQCMVHFYPDNGIGIVMNNGDIL